MRSGGQRPSATQSRIARSLPSQRSPSPPDGSPVCSLPPSATTLHRSRPSSSKTRGPRPLPEQLSPSVNRFLLLPDCTVTASRSERTCFAGAGDNRAEEGRLAGGGTRTAGCARGGPFSRSSAPTSAPEALCRRPGASGGAGQPREPSAPSRSARPCARARGRPAPARRAPAPLGAP